MNFFESIQSCFQNYAEVNGRASRSEFWYFQLFDVLCSILITLIDIAIFGSDRLSVIDYIFMIGTFLPGLAVTIRRLHDTNRSGKWYFISFTIIGIIPLTYWLCVKGTAGDNRFGADPLIPESPVVR